MNQNVQVETVACDLCGSTDSKVLHVVHDMKYGGPGEFQLRRCTHCGLMFLSPRPVPAAIGAYYPPTYSAYRPAVEDEGFFLMRWMRQRKLARKRQLVERYAGRQSGRVLDVGCATGLFLHEMTLGGWQAAGVELTPEAAEYARKRFGLDVFTGMLLEAPLAPASFDAMTFWDVMEHTYSPSAELARAAELVKPGGLLALHVPNWNSVDRLLFGPFWAGLDPPRHLYVFTRPTLTALLERAGFRPIKWACCIPSYFSFVISVERLLEQRAPRLAPFFTWLLNFPGVRVLFEPWFTLTDWLGISGNIAVFAVRS